MIVVRNGQVFKYSQKVFKYTSISIWVKYYLNRPTDINCSSLFGKVLNTVVEVFVTTLSVGY